MLAFEVGDAAPTSLASKERRERAEARERTEAAFRDEPFVPRGRGPLRRSRASRVDQAAARGGGAQAMMKNQLAG